MNAHQLNEDGLIINTIVVDDINVFPRLIDASIGGSVGDSIINGVLIPKAAPPVEVPQAVPMLSAKLALINSGHITLVNDTINAIQGTDGDIARAYWESSLYVHRYNPIVLMMQGVLSLSDDELDALFIAADAIKV